MKQILILLVSTLLLIGMISGCVEDPTEETKNIVETATENEDFTTLVNALIVAGLDTTLSDESTEFTVFAPTDAAFEKLNQTYLTNLVENDTDTLTKILKYHVISGTVMSSDLSNDMRAETVQGKYLDILLEEDMVYIEEALVTSADIECNNGVIHVIDTVMVPQDNIVETAIAYDDFETLVSAVVTAELDTTLSDESTEFTVFAPTDVAFAALDPIYLANLVDNDTANLTAILKYHVLSDVILSTDLSDNMTATTVEGTDITVQIMNQTVYIDEAKVTLADIECSNGVIHVIDAVVTP